jgi:hypothetical protein
MAAHTEHGGRQFSGGPGLAEHGGPPGEIVEQDAELGFGQRIGRLAVRAEGALDVRDG